MCLFFKCQINILSLQPAGFSILLAFLCEECFKQREWGQENQIYPLQSIEVGLYSIWIPAEYQTQAVREKHIDVSHVAAFLHPHQRRVKPGLKSLRLVLLFPPASHFNVKEWFVSSARYTTPLYCIISPEMCLF